MLKVLFFGTPDFAAEILSFLLAHQVQVVGVITKPDRPKGRSGTPQPTPVKLVAEAKHPPLPCLQPPIVSAPEWRDAIAAFNADLFVVVAYGEIIKQHLLDMPRYGCINVHPSLLPKYRGAAPIQHSIMNGDSKTGVTIMHMVRKMDAGDIIQVVEVPIFENTTFPELEKELCHVGSAALLDVIHKIEAGNAPRTPQDESQATLAPKIELEDCEIHWERPAGILHNLVRAVTPEPGAWCWVRVRDQRKRLKILRTEVVEHSGQPGEILSLWPQQFVVGCGEKALRILELQLEGKRAMTAQELMRGMPRDTLQF